MPRSGAPKPRSARRQAITEERVQFVRMVLFRRPGCEACTVLGRPVRPAVDVHELVRRSQGSPIVPSEGLSVSDVLAVCRPCHEWIGANPAKARSLDLIRWGWEAR